VTFPVTTHVNAGAVVVEREKMELAFDDAISDEHIGSLSLANGKAQPLKT
jgi:hypothetical protein